MEHLILLCLAAIAVATLLISVGPKIVASSKDGDELYSHLSSDGMPPDPE